MNNQVVDKVKDWAHELTTYINTHTYLVGLICGVITIALIIIFGLLHFYKDEIKAHRANKKLAKHDAEKVAELEKMKTFLQMMQTGILTGEMANTNTDKDNKTTNNVDLTKK